MTYNIHINRPGQHNDFINDGTANAVMDSRKHGFADNDFSNMMFLRIVNERMYKCIPGDPFRFSSQRFGKVKVLHNDIVIFF